MNFSSGRDRERAELIESERQRYVVLAAATLDARDRRRFQQRARRLARQAQMARTFPPSIWLVSTGLIMPLLAWALLKRADHPVAGLLTGGFVVAAELSLAGFRRLRPRGRAE